MPANRFYLNDPLHLESTVSITGPEHHHLFHVMRISKGERVELINGRGTLAIGDILEVDKKQAAIQIVSSSHAPAHALSLLLAIPLMRASKLEWVIEKGTELGAAGFIFYEAGHSEREELTERQIERLRVLSIQALKQSGSLYLPSFDVAADLETICKREALFLYGDLHTKKHIDPVCCKAASTIVFITGPEKGFTAEEADFLKEKAQGVRLNAHILRAETAPIAAAAVLGQFM